MTASAVLLHPGDELFFMVDAAGTDFGDGLGDRTVWNPTITVAEEVNTVHDSEVEYRNEQADLINDVRSDDWLYQYSYSITDRTPFDREEAQDPPSDRAPMTASWESISNIFSNIYRLETPWDDPTMSSPSHTYDDDDNKVNAFWLQPGEIHNDDINSRVWGIGMWTRNWQGMGHNLNVGPDWMQPVFGMDAVKTWVHTYPESKTVRLDGEVTLRDASVSGAGPVQIIVTLTSAATGYSSVLWSEILRSGNQSAEYDVSRTTHPGDRVHFLAHQQNNLHNRAWDGRTHTEAHIVDWTPKVRLSASTATPPSTGSGGADDTVIYPPSVTVSGVSYRVLQDNGEALHNPRMGLQHAIYDNYLHQYGGGTPPSETMEWFPGMSSVYIRIPWTFIQQEDGKYVWTRVDEILDYWGMKGKTAGFRFSTLESEHQAAPVYLIGLGAGGTYNAYRQFFGRAWVPTWDDAVFIAEYREMLEAFIERYDGDPRVDYVEVGSTGQWGEGGKWGDGSRVGRPAATAHARMFADVFEGSSIRVLFGDDQEKVDLAHAHGFGLFDDSISYGTRGAKQAEEIWRDRIIRVEYGQLYERDFWLESDPSRMLSTLEAYHASFYFPHAFPDRFISAFENVAKSTARRVGYRFNITDASWSERAATNQTVWFDLGMRNAGMAPNYDGGHVGIVLINGEHRAETVYRGFNTADLPLDAAQQGKVGHGAAEVSRLSIPVEIPSDFPEGEADVAVFIRRPQDYSMRNRSAPRSVVGDWLDLPWEYYELPLDNRFEHGERSESFSYIIGKITVDDDANAVHLSWPSATLIRPHAYQDQYSRIQGDLDDRSRDNDWTYRWAEVELLNGDYTPLAGTVTDMAYRQSGQDHGWVRSTGSYNSRPQIGGSAGIAHIRVDNDREAVLTWTNTATAMQAIMSGRIVKESNDGRVAVSVVHTSSGGTDTVLWGPTSITQADVVPFAVSAALGAGDTFNLVVTSDSSANAGVDIDNLLIVTASADSARILPFVADWVVNYRPYSLGDSGDLNRHDDWLYRFTLAGTEPYTPLADVIHNMAWAHYRGWTNSRNSAVPIIGDARMGYSVHNGHDINRIEPSEHRDAVLTWRNTRSGTTPVVVFGFVKTNAGCGNGLRISLLRDSTLLWGPTTVTSSTDVLFTAATTLSNDSKINLVINANGTHDDECDRVQAHYSILAYENLHDYTHIYRNEHATTQANTGDTSSTNNWSYRSATVPTGSYEPLEGAVSDLRLGTRRSIRAWYPSSTTRPWPRIGTANNFNYVHPGEDIDVILSWTNTDDRSGSFFGGTVTISGALQAVQDGDCAGDQDGIRFSIVKNTDTVLLNPVTIADKSLHPFSVITDMDKDDMINLVFNALDDEDCDEIRLYGLTVHQYPTDPPDTPKLRGAA